MRNIVVDICRKEDGSGRYDIFVDKVIVGEAGTKWGARRIAKRYIKNSFCERITYYRKPLPKEDTTNAKVLCGKEDRINSQ